MSQRTWLRGHPKSVREAFYTIWFGVLMALSFGGYGWLIADVPSREELLEISGVPSDYDYRESTGRRKRHPIKSVSFVLNDSRIALGELGETNDRAYDIAVEIAKRRPIRVLVSEDRFPHWSDDLIAWEVSFDGEVVAAYEEIANHRRSRGLQTMYFAGLFFLLVPYGFFWLRKHRRINVAEVFESERLPDKHS